MNTPQAIQAEPTPPVHVVNSFCFDVCAPIARVAPLFGAEAERGWAGEDWKPEFIYPQPGKDIQGAIFTVKRGSRTSVWVNTIFDVSGGRMQYVSFTTGVLVTTVDVKLTVKNEVHSGVEVTYTRTALQSAANDHVRQLGEADRDSAAEWKKAIETCLGLS